MPKKRDKDGLEFYKGKVRQLTKRVQQLERQLTRYQRTQHLVDEAHEILLEINETLAPVEAVEKKDLCTACNEGEMVLKFEFVELKKKIYQCTACGRTEGHG